MSDKTRILIAGAGIGGIVAALSLVQRGFEVALYEQASTLQEIGAGVQISANGSRILCALGLQAQMEAIAAVPIGKQVRLFSTGQAWKMYDVGTVSVEKFGAPYWMVHRGDFHAVLLAALQERAPGAVHLNARCVGFEQDESSVTLLLADGTRATGAALIGADGVHSRIRGALFGAGRANFTGFIAWRGVVPMERLPERLRAFCGENWMGPSGHVVTYPLRRGELLNFVAAVERSDWMVESWSEPGTKAEIKADLAPWHADVQTIIDAIDIPYKFALLGREPLPQWSVGRVTLLGDSCHPTLPFLAQGANMAIEDGMVLARCLQDTPDVPEALRRYETARIDRTSRIVRGANDNTGRFHNPQLANPAEAVAIIDREFHPSQVKQRYDWLFEYDALTVAV
jgi:salicylate hydroxylase